MTSKISFSSVVQCSAITLAVTVIVACGGSGGVGGGGGNPGSMDNAKRIAMAAIMYGTDYEERMVMTIDGPLNRLVNTDDKSKRTDTWALNLLPYHKDLKVYVDPERGDVKGIYSAPASATAPTTANTFRNQNAFPMYAYNYIFMSPIYETTENGTTTIVGAESRSFLQADEPAATVMFAESKAFSDPTRGWYGINAPCGWKLSAGSPQNYIVLWSGEECSGDWCGGESAGKLRTQAFHEGQDGGNVSFMDGHSDFMTAGEITAGTSYATAMSSGASPGGSTIEITDKSKYLWNLNHNYYGLDQQGFSKGRAVKVRAN